MTIEDRLVRLIETGGPIPLSTFMQIALHDPQDGYYAARPGLGRDFTLFALATGTVQYDKVHRRVSVVTA